MQLPDDVPCEAKEVYATTDTSTGATIRLWGYWNEDRSQWTEVVDIQQNGDTITVGYHPGKTFVASQTYNAMIEPFTDDDSPEKY